MGAGSFAKERVQSVSSEYADSLDSLMLQKPLIRGDGQTAVAIAALSFLSASSPNENSVTSWIRVQLGAAHLGSPPP